MRILAAVCAAVLTAGTCVLCWPAFADKAAAESGGQTLIVRVQYFGEWGDKIREKARFSRSDLEGMGAQEWYYSNVTNVGTVMSMRAFGPDVLTILEASGIDLGSVNNITFRTEDGYTRNFNIPQHLSGGRYFYPYLSSAYERSGDGQTMTPLEGSLADAQEVPAILALEFGTTKMPDTEAWTLPMKTKQTYRFCMGQTPLQEGVQTRPGFDGGDVSSMDSVHSIYGIDVTLAGSPVEGIGLDISDTELKVGSEKKVTAYIQGDELFADDFGEMIGQLHWSSSDESVVTVDQNGNIFVKGEGTATITVTADNGMTASITINGTAGDSSGGATKAGKATEAAEKSTKETTKPSKDKQKESEETTAKKESTSSTQASSSGARKEIDLKKHSTAGQVKAVQTIRMKEITLGDEILPETSPQDKLREQAMAKDAQALDEQKTVDGKLAAGSGGVAILVCGVGAGLRIRRFRIDMR